MLLWIKASAPCERLYFDECNSCQLNDIPPFPTVTSFTYTEKYILLYIIFQRNVYINSCFSMGCRKKKTPKK